MEFTAGTVPSLDGSEGWSFPQVEEGEAIPGPAEANLPMPVFARRHLRGLHRTAAMAMASSGGRPEPAAEVYGVQPESSGDSGEFWSSSSASPGRTQMQPVQPERRVRIAENVEEETDRSSQGQYSSSDVPPTPQRGDDPWMYQDPWQRHSWENYEVAVDNNENYEEQSVHESDSMSWSNSGSGSWSERGSGGRYEPDDKWENWSDGSHKSWSWRSDDSWQSHGEWGSAHSNWSSVGDQSWARYAGGRGQGRYRGDGGDQLCDQDRGRYGSDGGEHSWKSSSGYENQMEKSSSEPEPQCPQTPVSPQPPRDADDTNRPSGRVPSGHPSVAGGSGQEQQQAPSHGKIPSSYPPIFYARPGESWEEYWRSVTFWVASEGRSLPKEMQGPRLMQQLRERAAKIVQHLTVEQVSQSNGLDLIRQTIEASPIVKLLDQKRVDRRRQKFMKLSRLSGESLESFLNRADIYRRENQSSPAYQVGEQFYLGHLLDAAKLTKRDLALIKAAAGGALEDETAVTFAMLEMADQLEGIQGYPIGRGEPQIDHEDKYLVQKAASGTSSTSTGSTPTSSPFVPRRGRGRGRGFPRRRLRDALVAILEDDEHEVEETVEPFDEEVGTMMGDESCDEEEPDITAFAPIASDATMSAAGAAEPPHMAEIYAQEYKARNRVRQIKKMRQYFQKESQGPSGRRRDPNVQKWVEEQQKTEPCFICRQLGHWSQECPYRGQAPTRAANVVHSANVSFQHVGQQSDKADWDFLMSCARADEQYKGAIEPQYACLMVSPTTTNEVFWSMDELGNKMILDLGCMRTVAGTLWATPVVKEWRRRGLYVKVIPEKESFRFGDGHICESKVALIIQVTLASIPCLLRISVVSGKCPPLLSKPVATKLGLLIDTENHTVASRMYHVKAFGLGMAVNGHYLLSIQVSQETDMSIPDDFQMPTDAEVYPLARSGSKQVDETETPETHSPIPVHASDSWSRDGREQLMGDRGPGRRGVLHDRRGGAEAARSRSREFPEAQDQEAGHDETVPAPEAVSRGVFIGRDEGDARADGTDETDVSADEGDDGTAERCDAASDRGGRRGNGIQEGDERRQQRSSDNQRQSQEVSSTSANCGSDRPGSTISHPVDNVQRRPDLEHHPEHQVPVGDLQMEDASPDDADQACRGTGDRQRQRYQETLEAKSSLDHVDARQASSSSMGTPGLGQAIVQQSKDMVVSSSGNRARARPQEEGLLEPGDPNAPTSRELARRSLERYELVGHEERDTDRGGDLPEDHTECGSDQEEHAEVHHVDSGQSHLPRRKITLNRRQRRSIQQGIQRGLRTHEKIHEVLSETPHVWTLLEIFAGKARFSEQARKRKCWNVLQPQDILYGLDLLNPEHRELMKQVIQNQQPDVISLAPPCGPWSAWQRLRKNSFALRQMRKRHRPLWEFVVWVWAYQTSHGGLVLLEQPASSEALKLPEMSRREVVHERKIPMCALGLRDQVSKKPHKKMTAIQMNHSAIQTEMFREVRCTHQLGEHQPIEGSVRVRDQMTGKKTTVRRSTLAASWTTQFCDWLLDGLEALLVEGAQQVHIPMHEAVPSNRIWETVPVEIETSEEGQIRQEMARQQNALHDFSTKYEYISFAGTAALLNKRMRSTLAHLHVALGHVSNDKLARMLVQNGAKDEVVEAVKQLQCQICRRVCPPEIAPKAAFTRPSRFNERLVADSFHVWDSNQFRYTVTHVMCAFSMYMQAMVVKDANAQTTAELIRDRWIQVFGPPSVLMSDQGSEFMGQLEPVLKTFAVMHEVVPPTAHWRMALAERHGSVLKLMMMKIINQVSATNMDDMKMVVSSAVAARNQQARVSGFSPLQLVFGKDVSIPPNLMMAMEGQLKYHMAVPTDVEDAFRRASNVRAAAVDAFRWLETNEALRRAAGSRARLPRLELLTEGSQVMFWEPPAHRRGLSRRIQDNISWQGPAVVVGVERMDGAIKRVWVRYRHKLRGLPLEFVRLAVAEELEASQIAKEALLDLEQQLNEGRVNAEVLQAPEGEGDGNNSETDPEDETDKPNRPAKRPSSSPLQSGRPPKREREDAPGSTGARPREQELPPIQEYSDEELVTQEDIEKATSPLDDVPLAMLAKLPKGRSKRKTKEPMDPALLPFADKQSIFNQEMKKTKVHMEQMKSKLQPGAASSSQAANVVMNEDPRFQEVPPPFRATTERLPRAPNWRSGIYTARDFEREDLRTYDGPFHEPVQAEESDTEELSEAFDESLSNEHESSAEVFAQEEYRRAEREQASDVLQVMRPPVFGDNLVRTPSEEFAVTSALRSVRSMPYNFQGRHSPAMVAWFQQGLNNGWEPQATPMTRASPSGQLALWEQSPPAMRSRLNKRQQVPILMKQHDPAGPPKRDYWLVPHDLPEIWRIHVRPRRCMFHPFYPPPDEPGWLEYGVWGPFDAERDLPEGYQSEDFSGWRTTQVIYVHNPLPRMNSQGVFGDYLRTADPIRVTGPLRLHELLVDNILWTGWNSQQDLGAPWQGITRFQVSKGSEPSLKGWLTKRQQAEELWKEAQQVMHLARYIGRTTGWPRDTQGQLEEVQRMHEEVFHNQNEVAEIFYQAMQQADARQPRIRPTHHGWHELAYDADEKVLDVRKPDTGKLRLELKWNDLTPAWQRSFEEPIVEAIDVYFRHDALAPVMPEDFVDASEVLPSRFVLVNKSDPKNPRPTDDDLENAKLKARWVIAGHKDQKAGDFETESPTASLLAHNLLIFFAVQWDWKMFFADISAAFLQGDYLPETRRVFVQAPRNYPMFVRQFLMKKLPGGARTDLLKLKKAGFGLAESPRLWYQRFKRDTEAIGGREWKLVPGVFSFFSADSKVIAMLAVHVDDIRFIVTPEEESRLCDLLNQKFNFGDWKAPTTSTRFCGRYEKQMPDGTIEIDMEEYVNRLQDPPKRTQGQRHGLLPNEKKWIGTLTGQLNWLARQCRADLAFGVSRIQQLAGVGDPTALAELQILVDRARETTKIKFHKLGCSLSDIVVLGISDASFAGMPRGRSQGGYVLALANPQILDGQSQLAVLAYHSGLIRRVVRSSLAAEISQAANTLEEADFLRATMAEATQCDFQLNNWVAAVSQWKQLVVLDSRTGYDLLNGSALGEDKRLAIDIAAMKEALGEDQASRGIRWVPGEELLADDLTKLRGNGKLATVLRTGVWALKDTDVAKKLRADAAVRKRLYRQRISEARDTAEQERPR